MAIYEYKGISGDDYKYTEGDIEAINLDEATHFLKEKRIIITSLEKAKGQRKEKKKNTKSILLFLDNIGSIKSKEIALFIKKLATMVKAGLRIDNSLEMTFQQVTDKKLKKIISEIISDLKGGTDLSGCFSKHPKVFDNICVNMIKAGEASGKLDIFLNKLVGILEKREKIKSQIKSAMTYPTVLILVALSVTTLLLIKVVPQFEQIYGDMGASLPTPTLVIISLSNFISGIGGLIILFLIILLIFTHTVLMKSLKQYKKYFDKILLKLPLFGNIIIQSTVARIALIKANLFAAGVNTLEILDISMSSTTNTVFINSLEKIKRGVFSGEDMSKCVGKESVFPLTYSQLIAVGEESGKLEEMFEAIANYYEEEFDTVVKNISALIEPIAIVLIGGIIAMLLVSMYLPMLQMGSVVSGVG